MDLISGSETIQVLRKTETGVDEYNNPVYSTTSHYVERCLVEIGAASVTQTLFRDFAKIEVTIYAPNGTEFEETDQIVLRGKKYILSEEPKVWIPMAGSILSPRVILGLVRWNG